MSTSLAATPKRDSAVAHNLAIIAVAVALVGICLAYLIDAAGRRAHEVSATGRPDAVIARTLGGTALTIPAAWFASDPSETESFAKQVDLVLHLPLGPGAALRKIDVTLTQRSRVRPSASLLDGVYLHQFKPEQINGPLGLIGKPLIAAEGYEDETVWYDPLNASPFVAKCSTPIAADQPGRCLRTVYLGSGIAAVYGFPDDVLQNWKKLDAELHPLLNQIGAL